MGTANRKLPDDPLGFIRFCVREERMVWTYHIGRRLEKRRIGRSAIVAATETYEVVESYPDDKYLPSYLILAWHEGEAFHVLFRTVSTSETSEWLPPIGPAAKNGKRT